MNRLFSKPAHAWVALLFIASVSVAAWAQTAPEAYATVGEAIAKVDPVVASARTAEADPQYAMGFDVATGIFGDPALGARGNTATGPGSLGIRDALSPAAQRGFNAAVTLHLSRKYGRGAAVVAATEGTAKSPYAGAYQEIQASAPTPVGAAVEKVGGAAVVDKGNASLPGTSKRLIISAEGSHGFQPVPSGKLYQSQTDEGEIWLTLSYEDGAPFKQSKAADIHIETLSTANSSGHVAKLDPSGSRPSDGLWHFTLPLLDPGDHFYLIKVLVDVKAWRSTFEGQTVVRASYTRMPFWNAQRVDGTIWEPPK